MAVVCKKCGYTRGPHEDAPPSQCPNCGAVYAKVEAHLKRMEARKKRQRSTGTEDNVGNEASQHISLGAPEDKPRASEHATPPIQIRPPKTNDPFKPKPPEPTTISPNDMPSEPKQFWIAFLLNFFLAGAGHLYAGQNQVGVILLVINIVSWALVATGVGVVGVLASWIYGLATTDKVVKEFNSKVTEGEQIRAKQEEEETKRKKNVVAAQEVAEAFMKAHKLRSLDILTEREFAARKATIIGELRFKEIQGDPDDILFALVPMKQAGAISDDEITSLKRVLASI